MHFSRFIYIRVILLCLSDDFRSGYMLQLGCYLRKIIGSNTAWQVGYLFCFWPLSDQIFSAYFWSQQAPRGYRSSNFMITIRLYYSCHFNNNIVWFFFRLLKVNCFFSFYFNVHFKVQFYCVLKELCYVLFHQKRFPTFPQ